MVTITYRFHGVDVSANAPHIDYIQWDSDAPAFSAFTTSMDVVWGGVPYHYNPAFVGPAPLMFYASAFRVGASGPIGDGTVSGVTLHTANGDIVADPLNPNNGITLSQTPTGPSNPFAGLAPGMVMSSDYVNASTLVLGGLQPAMGVLGRGIAIAVPTVKQWQLQRAAVRPAPGEKS